MHSKAKKESVRLENLINQKIRSLDFLQDKYLYFSTHDFGDVPDFLLSKIESLSECSLNTSVWSTHGYCKNIIADAKQFVHCIFTQPPFLLADTFSLKLQTSVKMKFLFGQNSDIPECNDLVDKLDLDKPKISEKFDKRICDKVLSNVVVSDVGGCLILPDTNGMSGQMNSIVGQNLSFIDWCSNFFDYKWSTGKQFARLR